MDEFALSIICCWPVATDHGKTKRVYLRVLMTELLITYSCFDRWVILKTIHNRTGV